MGFAFYLGPASSVGRGFTQSMSAGKDPDERYRLARVAGMATMIPFLLVAAPLIGLFGGRWIDGWVGTSPWIEMAGLILGGIAGIQQTYYSYKKLMRDFNR